MWTRGRVDFDSEEEVDNCFGKRCRRLCLFDTKHAGQFTKSSKVRIQVNAVRLLRASHVHPICCTVHVMGREAAGNIAG